MRHQRACCRWDFASENPSSIPYSLQRSLSVRIHLPIVPQRLIQQFQLSDKTHTSLVGPSLFNPFLRLEYLKYLFLCYHVTPTCYCYLFGRLFIENLQQSIIKTLLLLRHVIRPDNQMLMNHLTAVVDEFDQVTIGTHSHHALVQFSVNIVSRFLSHSQLLRCIEYLVGHEPPIEIHW